MSGAYLAEPYDESDPVVREADMQAALLAWNPIYVDQENGTRTGSFYLVDNEINFDTQVGSDSPVSRRVIDDVNLIPNLIALVTANTGREPLDNETFKYRASDRQVIWGDAAAASGIGTMAIGTTFIVG